MIPLCLVTGFLGSGKTTFLERVARTHADRRLVYLVNEFSALDVDGGRIEADGRTVVSITGGSIFCKCLTGEFIRHLTEVVEKHHLPEHPVEGVVVEASGMADPLVAGHMLTETGLERHYRLANVVCLADPANLQKLLQVLPSVTSQIRAADHVLLNKCDLRDPACVDAAAAEVQGLNPRATVHLTRRAEASFPLFPEGEMQQGKGEYAKCKDPHFGTFTLAPEQPVELDTLQAAFEASADLVYRAKGFLFSDQGWFFVEFSGSGFSARPAGSPPREPGMAVIVRGGAEEEIRLRLAEGMRHDGAR